MNEIEKLYINANVEDKNINNQLYKDLNYPQFTAEKQLELIKWLAKRNYGDYTSSLLINITDERVYFSAGAKPNYYVIEVLYDSNRCTDFKNALANLINNLWQDLTEEERKQVRGILNS